MITVIFTHGTGTREPEFTTQFNLVRDELLKRRADLAVVPCGWGEEFGWELYAGGVSVPEYATTHGPGSLGGDTSVDRPLSDEEYLVALWGLLYSDPLGELRLLALEPTLPQALPAATALDGAVQRLTLTGVSPELRTKLAEGGIDTRFEAAAQRVRSDPAYIAALQTMTPDEFNSYRQVVARAIIAAALPEGAQHGGSRLVIDATLRDDIVDQLSRELALDLPGQLGWFDPIKNKASELIAQLVSNQLRQRRGPLLDKVMGFVGDILVYQANGDAIRQRIRETIQQATPPVVVLAHSLGGVACVDLLISENLREHVPLLVTVGSQAPVLYEVGALHSLKFSPGATLPTHMPRWLNMYDVQDFLSYVGAGVFPGRVEDHLVDNRQPFPFSHSAYWTNPAMWTVLVEAINAIG